MTSQEKVLFTAASQYSTLTLTVILTLTPVLDRDELGS